MKKVLFSLLALAAMVGCSKSELTSRPDGSRDENVEIKVKSVARSIETRAPFEGEIAEANKLTARVLVSKTESDYTTPYHSGDMTFADNGTTYVGFDGENKAYYPADGSTLYLCGLYPADVSWTGITTEANYVFDGKTDLMAAAQQSSSKADVQGGTHPTLTFKHLLTKLVVEIVAENQAAIDTWGDVTEITLSAAAGANVFNKATVTLSDGTAPTATAFSQQAVNGLPFYTITDGAYGDTAFTAQTYTLTTPDPVAAAYSLVTPITATGTNDYKIKVTTKKGAEAALTNEVAIGLKKKDADAAFEGDTQGKAFTITLTFKATDIDAAAKVTAWEDGGSSDVEIQ